MGIIDIISITDPKPRPDPWNWGWVWVRFICDYINNLKSIVFDLCKCETGVQMEDNEGGIGEKEICKYTCSSWRSTVAFLLLGDSDEPVAKIIVTRWKRIVHPVGSTLFSTRSLAVDIIFRLYQEIRRNISTHIFTPWYSVHIGE